jgi:glycosyltransferase involved in cell wall biosynthesis
VPPSEPMFTVIIPTYRRRGLLEEAVASVLAQTVEDFEIVVVDDASPEPPAVPDDARIRVVRRERRGTPPAARNTALATARGRYVTFLDDDDRYTPDRLEMALPGLSTGANLAICWIQPYGGFAGPKSERRFAQNENRPLAGNVLDTVLHGTRPHLGQVAIERRICPLFDERFIHVEDVEWWLRTAVVARVVSVPRVGYLIRRHETPGESPQFSHDDESIRVGYKLLFLQEHAEYFRAHPRAAASQWKDVGRIAAKHGDHTLARRALIRAIRLHPRPRLIRRLLRSIRPDGDQVPQYLLPPDLDVARLRGLVPDGVLRRTAAEPAREVVP